MKVALIHAYSAANAGDGLLVDASIRLIGQAIPSAQITVFARYPETFAGQAGVRYVSSRLFDRGINWRYFRTLMQLSSFDLVIGVGGGYLRFGSISEALKTALAHGPQLLAAARVGHKAVYLPQSIGPAPRLVWSLIRPLLSRMARVHLRDDRSVEEASLSNGARTPDLAILDTRWSERRAVEPVGRAVVTTRALRRTGRIKVQALASQLEPFDAYVQSTGAGNDDTEAVSRLCAERTLQKDEYLHGASRRVVVAVRLHAALMGLRAGHWVVHLAYERKGFGAFNDLGLGDWVRSVYAFDAADVAEQVRRLMNGGDARARYDAAVGCALSTLSGRRDGLIREIRTLAGAEE